MGADSPDAWARDNRADVARYARRIGEITARSRDVCLPGVPLALVFAFFANNGLDENTTSWISGSAREREEALAKGRKPLGGQSQKGVAPGQSRPGLARHGGQPGSAAGQQNMAWDRASDRVNRQ